MSDEKKAKLEAIRAAKAAAGGSATPAPPIAIAATPAAAPATTVATTPTTAPAAAKPAAAPAKPAGKDTTSIAANSIIDLSLKGRIIRIVAGILFCGIIGFLLASVTGDYLIGTIFGVFIGAALWRLSRHAVVPFNDPHFAQSVQFENV